MVQPGQVNLGHWHEDEKTLMNEAIERFMETHKRVITQKELVLHLLNEYVQQYKHA